MGDNLIIVLVAGFLALCVAMMFGYFWRAGRGGESPKGRRSLIGKWTSRWGNTPEMLSTTETLVIAKHRGSYVSGYAFMPDAPNTQWKVQGRFSGEQFLQMYWFPFKPSGQALDYGVYFLRLHPQGHFSGRSTTFEGSGEMSFQWHELRRDDG